ncbi:hypothetical protein A1O3_04679 [Capronia epimyces CBS 606.96]|uniref:Xylanolytic transcriptional activator regulatory domain-containing protein n=1 Tax=Capronia epimyces CBS 606.96 TaxID=1182542 RepID=W9XTY8_9EURO|nr:uncharacterized protein A1O3_04679 [Capronia epimyces CBS 606.96]EXJ84012.1 hypothetical protein A1O3_04679 [Capronia epimyces CBS 606.96]
MSNVSSPPPGPASSSTAPRIPIPTVTGKFRLDAAETPTPSRSGKEHLLLIDADDQIVYSGPSTGMPLFARLGLLHTVEVSESDTTGASFASHSAGALGITGATTSSGDFFDLCLQHCPQELMFKLIGYHLNTRQFQFTCPLSPVLRRLSEVTQTNQPSPEAVFFPLLHAPSFLSEFVAVTQRRLVCTAQYGAFLMSILAVTVRLVESAKALLPASERDQAGEAYFELAQDFLRISKNKLDIRHILALYHLALFAEGRTGSASAVSSFVAEAVGLAFTTGLHRSTKEFNMDPVTLQIRTRLFWALYTLDTALAYSQGRPPLIRLSECSVELPVIVDNEYIKKTEILPQPEGDPPLAMAAAVKMIEIYMVLEQALSAINAPSRTPAAAFSLADAPLDRSELMRRAQNRLDKIERDLPPYLSQAGVTPNPSSNFFHSCRVRTTLQFVRTLIARQALMDELELEAGPGPGPGPSKEKEVEEGEEEEQTETQTGSGLGSGSVSATYEACRLSVDTVKTYSRLRHLGLLRFCGFHAVSHVTAAAHTLIACMLRSSNLAFEHRPDLLTAIDLLLVFSSPFPYVETVAQLLVQLSRTLDHNHGSDSQSEAVAIRVLARRMARSPSRSRSMSMSTSRSRPIMAESSTSRSRPDPPDSRFKHAVGVGVGSQGPSHAHAHPQRSSHPSAYSAPSTSTSTYNHSSLSNTSAIPIPPPHPPPPLRGDASTSTSTSITTNANANANANSNETSAWISLLPTDSVEPQGIIHHPSADAVWEDSFSFLNDGLFSKL